MISIRGLSKTYGGEEVLRGIDLDIRPGEIIGLFGPNGAGKTTFMKSVFGFISYSGSITLDEEPIDRRNIERLSFATCEHSFFPNIDAKEHARFYKELFGTFKEKRFETLMDFFRLPMDRKIKSLSAGQQNQFEVIMALSQGADYIFMDEPFTGNDIFNREDFYKVLLGMLAADETVVLSTHLIEEVSGLVSRAVLIDKGSIIDDVSIQDLEEQGVSLVDHIKKSFSYESDRVFRALSELDPEVQ